MIQFVFVSMMAWLGQGRAIVCTNPILAIRQLFVDPSVEAELLNSGWSAVFVTAHQRHLDRWMYEHDLIENRCWDSQLNSSSSPVMKAQCALNLSSVWQHFDFAGDPYAAPLAGTCNAKQLTVQGEQHASSLGTIYRNHFVKMGLLSPSGRAATTTTASVTCGQPSDAQELDPPIVLECDSAQKNQKTTEMVHSGLCDGAPLSTQQHPASSVLDDGTLAPGRPFYIRTAVCQSLEFSRLRADAQTAMLQVGNPVRAH
jgi:hypothetical protein